MPDALEEFARETIDQLLKKLPPEKRLAGLTTQERLMGLSVQDRLMGLSSEDLRNLSPQEREAIVKLLIENQ